MTRPLISSASDEDWAHRLQALIQPLLDLQPLATKLGGLMCVCDFIESRLRAHGFEVHRHVVEQRPPVLVATRPGQGPLRVGLSGHYDVEEALTGWTVPAFETTVQNGRIFARGIADNLGPLLLRLESLPPACDSPSLVWVLQGEEEVGSPAAHAVYPTLDLGAVDLWLEETGYFELDGTQRLLCRRLDRVPAQVEHSIVETAAAAGRSVVKHDRYMNKAFGENRCPFLTHLIGDSAYVALGPNDPSSRIHDSDESLPISNLTLSVEQFRAVLCAASQVQ